MIILSLNLKSLLISNPFVDRFMEGGPLFMSLILICLLVSIFFLVRGFLSLNKNLVVSKKMTALASDASLLGLVMGFLGSIIGLISAFDAIESMDSISSNMLAGGLKVSFLTTVFGSITFILPRIGIIILKMLQKS
ncbi:MotA/TolQ/ExbB proton channel family protein [Flavivirga spongiicola]|uniref:MotA/TolQ/ExbB proton channel family protein n=1 Tax=Flavivirga spongiicola TaxID=421621 RepID=A0ABU7XYV7_9FLAO|nr:MotA/TolQ/ExbB proton channel family protein [Flavivirga sp. MEBiC05379]MDO5980976.1 MotA/TolQ/ExbB proton channel family protein [Flavivirga sp. MEBiC05379]